MIRFLYGCFCLICLLVLGASLAGWVYSDRVAGAGDTAFASRTMYAGHYQLEGRHAHGTATLIATPGTRDDAGAFHPADGLAPATQPVDATPPRWQLGPAKLTLADGLAGKTVFAQAPYWLLAAVAALPLLLWLALPRRKNPRLCQSCHTNLRGSPAQCKKCGSGFTVAQY